MELITKKTSPNLRTKAETDCSHNSDDKGGPKEEHASHAWQLFGPST